MRKLTTALGLPQHRFASIHVVGTNGKSSVTRMTAALLQAHGLRAGACVSPHVDRWSQRTLVGGEEIDAEAVRGRLEARREELRSEVARAEGKLGNEGFVSRAPAEVVEEERQKLERYRAELEELSE